MFNPDPSLMQQSLNEQTLYQNTWWQLELETEIENAAANSFSESMPTLLSLVICKLIETDTFVANWFHVCLYIFQSEVLRPTFFWRNFAIFSWLLKSINQPSVILVRENQKWGGKTITLFLLYILLITNYTLFLSFFLYRTWTRQASFQLTTTTDQRLQFWLSRSNPPLSQIRLNSRPAVTKSDQQKPRPSTSFVLFFLSFLQVRRLKPKKLSIY